MRRSLKVTTGLLVALLGSAVAPAGCAGSPSPSTESPASDTAPTPTGSDEPDEPAGTNACHQLRAAVAGAALMQPGTVESIVTASDTADAPVADAAQRLATAYTAAVGAKGSDREPDAVAAVSMAGAAMSDVCDDSGLDTVG